MKRFYRYLLVEYKDKNSSSYWHKTHNTFISHNQQIKKKDGLLNFYVCYTASVCSQFFFLQANKMILWNELKRSDATKSMEKKKVCENEWMQALRKKLWIFFQTSSFTVAERSEKKLYCEFLFLIRIMLFFFLLLSSAFKRISTNGWAFIMSSEKTVTTQFYLRPRSEKTQSSTNHVSLSHSHFPASHRFPIQFNWAPHAPANIFQLNLSNNNIDT